MMNGKIIGAPSSIARLSAKKTGNMTALKNINFAPRRIPLRRGDRETFFSAKGTGVDGMPPLASQYANPLMGRPQREQNFISSEICF
jgi:hypothetical protein